MATGMRALLDTVVQALPQVGQQPRPRLASLPQGHVTDAPRTTGRGRASLGQSLACVRLGLHRARQSARVCGE